MNDTRRAVLDAIEDGPASGPDIADRLGVSRTAVWNEIEALREEGFAIESDGEGYELGEVPEYGAGAVAYHLDGFDDLDNPFAVEYHETIESTNERARDLAREGASDAAVLADEQTGGRGRLDRAWDSPPGGIWMSALLRPDLPPARAPLLTLAAAVATARAVRAHGVDAGLKWPNDVLVADEAGAERSHAGTGTERKLAGILTEMEGETDEVSWVVVGIGINANVDAGTLPEGATSLRKQVGDVDRARLVADLLGELDALRAEPSEVLPAWRDRSVTLGRRVRIETGEESIVGEATGIEPPGTLRVDTGGGERRVHAGDCEHLRPAEEER
ncbi:MAG: biotin--[acetyl-CoA-carboxylase] ligase [Halobacteriales archaeon]